MLVRIDHFQDCVEKLVQDRELFNPLVLFSHFEILHFSLQWWTRLENAKWSHLLSLWSMTVLGNECEILKPSYIFSCNSIYIVEKVVL